MKPGHGPSWAQQTEAQRLIRQGALEERAAIVAWLRTFKDSTGGAFHDRAEMATAIERGEQHEPAKR